jgi:hypothetical protein
MKRLVFALFVMTCSASTAGAAGLTLSMRDGLVSIDAQDVTVRQILSEWERVGKTRIVNAERIAGGPITLKFDAVPEKQALDIILRSIPGYMALPRATRIADASLYERVLIMATTTQVAPLRAQQPPPAGFPGMQGAQGGASVTQLRPGGQGFPPGMLLDPPDQADQMDDPAMAAAAAAGLVPAPGFLPGQAPLSGPLMPPGMPAPAPAQPAQGAAGTGAPTNPWNAPVGTAQPSLPTPPPAVQAPPPVRARPPQADR